LEKNPGWGSSNGRGKRNRPRGHPGRGEWAKIRGGGGGEGIKSKGREIPFSTIMIMDGTKGFKEKKKMTRVKRSEKRGGGDCLFPRVRGFKGMCGVIPRDRGVVEHG